MNPFLDTIVSSTAQAAELDEGVVRELIAIPPDDKLGDYALPCFTLAKQLHKSPVEIAAEIGERLQPVMEAGDQVAEVVVTGPYVNFRLHRPSFVQHTLDVIAERGDRYGSRGQGEGKTVVIDFSSPNLAKPFSIAHLRSTAIGHAIYRIHDFLDWKCVGINHYGDYGANFGQLLAAYQLWGDPEKVKANPVPELLKLYVRFTEEERENPELREEARSRLRRLANADAEMVELWQFFVSEGRKEAERIYGILGVSFDEYRGESEFADDLDKVVDLFESKGLAEESEGALIVRLEGDDDEEVAPCMLRTSNRTSTYHSRDIAALLYRHKSYNFGKMIYVVDARQELHFRQVFQAMEKAGVDWVDNCVHAPFGLMSFKGQAMSTRRGTIVILEEVLDQAIELTREIIAEKNPELVNSDQVAKQVGIGAVVFADINNRRTRDISFSLEEVLTFEGETGPYLQYTHARFCSILRRHGKPVDLGVDVGRLDSDKEMRVARQLAAFPDVVAAAADEIEPSQIASFLLELATLANRFYNEVPVLAGDDEGLVAARIRLVDAIRSVLRSGLDLLGLQVPEEM
ncbi:MAG: arginine--tRNA ligase [Candidatus Latescibacterota bacterium]|nr:arginine--tRNA ligase [Candidatus Latescibacterota bacterium]